MEKPNHQLSPQSFEAATALWEQRLNKFTILYKK